LALTAGIGARRNEVLAFRWVDFDPEKTIRVERAIEVTKKFGIRYKPPKTWRGLRTVALDDGTVAIERGPTEFARIGPGARSTVALCPAFDPSRKQRNGRGLKPARDQ
jgi:integrase